MSNKQNIITVTDLKTYFYSLEDEHKQMKEEKVNKYKEQCEETNQEIKDKEIQKIQKTTNKEYEIKNKTKDEILNLLEEYSEIPSKIQKLEIAEYMLYRVDIRKAEKILNKVAKRLTKRCNEIVKEIEEKIENFSSLEEIEKVDFDIYKITDKALKETKEKYKEEYTEKERIELIQKELDIIEKTKLFNTIPIPHEILKSSDKDIQSKMHKFNNIRQKRLRIISTMEEDYLKLIEPREINCMIDDAILNIESVKDILKTTKYNAVKKNLIKKRKRIYRKTSEIRDIIKYKEKKTGIIYYNIQEARYQRMEKLRNIITEATNIIKQNNILGAEEQLEKLKISYEREKQFASVIEQLEEGSIEKVNDEVKVLEEQIRNIEQKVNISKNIINEQKQEIEKAKKELIVLWKIEINTVISNKKETLELPESTEEKGKNEKNIISKIVKSNSGKHACV